MPTPSDPGTRFLGEFIDLRDSLRDQRIGRGGLAVSEALTGALDRAIAAMVAPLPERVAVVALGGYGRMEMSPHSDVDLMLLHEMDDPSGQAAELFRPLWDAKLRVGHSVRTVKESAVAARERFDTQTTLLTSRLVVGDADLFESLAGHLTAVTRARPLRRHLVAEERRRRDETPFIRMAVNVKTGRGGLRTLHSFDWERRREALIGRFSAELGPEEAAARETLTRIRNAIHVVTGRRHDEFSVDLREAVSNWLGVGVAEAARELVGALQTVDSLAAGRWPEILEEDERVGRRIWLRISGRPGPLTLDRPPGLAEVLWMLEGGEQGRSSFERLASAGLLEGVLPEWQVVRGLPQLAPFHEHPVDIHLWRTVAEMQRLISEGGEYSRVAGEVEEGLLLLAAFLHDIGKGQGRPHAEAGGDVAARFCERMGASPRWTGDIEHAVVNHLLLSQTATRRDLDDPAVIDEIAAIVGEVHRLNLLYLLTVADSRATGPTMWSDWKAVLLRTLFIRVAQRLEGEGMERVIGTTEEQVLAAAGEERADLVTEHLAGMPPEYLLSTRTEDVVRHAEALRSLRQPAQLEVRLGDLVEQALVVGESSPQLRRHVAETFAANGIDVLEARLHTRSDGLVVDTFQVRHDRSGGEVGNERWDQTRRDLGAALAGQFDPSSKVESRANAYEPEGLSAAKPSVACSIDSATGDVVVVVKCSDRVGRLAEILAALEGCGLEVHLAKLDSRGDEVVDTFHVRADVTATEVVALDGLARLIEAGITP